MTFEFFPLLVLERILAETCASQDSREELALQSPPELYVGLTACTHDKRRRKGREEVGQT